MTLVEFCRACGFIISEEPPIGRWARYPTTDKPNKKNGAVRNMGGHAFVQNNATMTAPDVWKPEQGDRAPMIDHAAVAAQIEKESQIRKHAQMLAARKAAWILGQCVNEGHAYLEAKGFPLEQGNVWHRQAQDGTTAKLLCVPMRVDGNLVGLQMIAENGAKKFLKGARTQDAIFVFDNHGPTILTEGYATALSIRAALQNMRKRYKLIVAFSAGNMGRIADGLPDCFIVADNDASGTGQRVAHESGRRFFMPPLVGKDFNDYWKDVGVFKASQALRSAMS